MKPLVVLYATREGHTRKIAEYIQAAVRERGRPAAVLDVRELREPFSLGAYGGAIVAASVHAGKHEPEMVDFVKRHRDELEGSGGFLSVSLQEAGAEDRTRPDADRAKAAGDAQRVLDQFVTETGWRPRRVLPVAGALLYSKYNFILRFVMKRIARKASMPTDTSRDYDFTDWTAIDRFVDEVLSERVFDLGRQEAPLAPSQRT